MMTEYTPTIEEDGPCDLDGNDVVAAEVMRLHAADVGHVTTEGQTP